MRKIISWKVEILEEKLSDQSEVFNVRLTTKDFSIDFAAADFKAACRLSQMLELGDVVGADIFDIHSQSYYKGLARI